MSASSVSSSASVDPSPEFLFGLDEIRTRDWQTASPKRDSNSRLADRIPELIFSGEYTKAMNKDWHSSHFCCWKCDESLTGQRYVLRDENPYCIKCYETVFANTCDECSKIIGIDSKDLSYKEKHWHELCFLCNSCRVSLVDKQFGAKFDKVYCGNCYDAQFATRCDGCGDVFRAERFQCDRVLTVSPVFRCCVTKSLRFQAGAAAAIDWSWSFQRIQRSRRKTPTFVDLDGLQHLKTKNGG
ncbi:unnamed protein product [Cyprideis torosa]|uniref:Uncharacterized protein n=1 Tax=Cyprideis torosa TaxID=163714 RepID=A0A7R8W589_9CRUS|nr:unnamed protein product [Cyprideis torosa]CAG0885009.1 unnamed protein product [Cyprideis torosa]